VQIDFAVRGVALQVFCNERRILFDLLLDLNGTTVVDEVSRLKREGLGDSHACRSEQNVKHALLSFSVRYNLRNSPGFQRGRFCSRYLTTGKSIVI
jgi:hypothetical protein